LLQAAMRAAEMARQAAAVAQASAAASAALRSKVERLPHHESPSPERRRGHRGRSLVVQTMYKESRAGTPWPMLTKTNYNEWSLLMKVKMQA